MWEIARCQENSCGVAFVTMLGDRYGYRPFPRKIPQVDLDVMILYINSQPDSAQDVALIEKWYKVDTNIQPPMYLLQPISTFLPDYINDHDQTKDANGKTKQQVASGLWWATFEIMQAALRKAAIASLPEKNETRILCTISVTNEEVMRGIIRYYWKASIVFQ